MSGVLAKDRKINKDFETIIHAQEMRLSMTSLLFRDFGTHNKKDVIRQKYKVHMYEDSPEEEYRWLLDEEREKISVLLGQLCSNLTGANSIFPTNRSELQMRRSLQDKAICNCFQIKAELQYIVTVFNVNVDKFIPYSDRLDYEISLIKGWRQSNKKFMPTIRKNEENKKREELKLDEQLQNELKEEILQKLLEELNKDNE